MADETPVEAPVEAPYWNLERLGYAFDLDGGGYEFEWAKPPFSKHAVVWDDPDADYMGVEIPRGWSTFIVVDPTWQASSDEFPETVTYNGDRYIVVNRGQFYEADRECNCHGRAVPPGEGHDAYCILSADECAVLAAREGAEPIPTGALWLSTGDSRDGAHPSCHRCEGTGLVDAPNAAYAVYQLQDDDDDEGEDDDDSFNEHGDI